jgi:hypothetical protein
LKHIFIYRLKQYRSNTGFLSVKNITSKIDKNSKEDRRQNRGSCKREDGAKAVAATVQEDCPVNGVGKA